MKARDWLIQKGLAKPGRGKFSNNAKIALNEAIANGTKFSDWPKEDTGPVVKTAVRKPRNSESAGMVDYVPPEDYRFPEAEYKAVPDGKLPYGMKTVGMRECCETCRVSLVNHSCNTPVVFGVPVRIVAK